MFIALRLAWIPTGDQNWCVVPRHLFSKMGGLHFLLRCNYTKYTFLPTFYKEILEFFKELKILYGYDHANNLIIFNNKEILVDKKLFT